MTKIMVNKMTSPCRFTTHTITLNTILLIYHTDKSPADRRSRANGEMNRLRFSFYLPGIYL